MKKLFLVASVMASAAFCRAQDVIVHNNTGSPVSMIFGAEDSGVPCTTSITNTSSLYVIPTGTSYFEIIPTGSFLAIPWMNPPTPSTAIRYIRPHDAAGANGYDVWSPCTGIPPGNGLPGWTGMTNVQAWPVPYSGPVEIEIN